MALTLDVNGKFFEGKCNFYFDQVATLNFGTDEVKKKKNGEEYATGNKVSGSGIQAILSDLLELKIHAVVDFWECALAGYRQDKPSREEIEVALMNKIEKEGDTLPVIKEVVNEIDQSAFFKQDMAKFLKQFSLMDRMTAATKEEELQKEIALEMVTENLKALGLEIPGSTTKKSK